MAKRAGLNCTLTYSRNGRNRTLKIRVDGIGHGLEMIAEESSGRHYRAYYPHKVAPSRFYLNTVIVGQNERDTVANWMQDYADYIMNPSLAAGENFPAMRVLVPARKFDREGVPLTGFEWGDTVGKVVWTPRIVFETTQEPQDTSGYALSSFHTAPNEPDTRYFYPMGTQLAGNQVPSGSYDRIIGPKGPPPPPNWYLPSAPGGEPDYRQGYGS